MLDNSQNETESNKTYCGNSAKQYSVKNDKGKMLFHGHVLGARMALKSQVPP